MSQDIVDSSVLGHLGHFMYQDIVDTSGVRCAVVADEADMFHPGCWELMLGDEFPGAGAPKRHGGLADEHMELLPGVVLTDAVDNVTDAHSPVGPDCAAVFAGRHGGAGAMDDIANVVGPFGACASGSAVADVLGARLRPGVFKEELAGVVVELHALIELSYVDGVSGEFTGDLIGHAAYSDGSAGLHPHRPHALDVERGAGGFPRGLKEYRPGR